MKKFLLVVGFASVTFGMRLCAGDVHYCPGKRVQLPPPGKIGWILAELGFQGFADDGLLQKVLGGMKLCRQEIEHEIQWAVNAYTSTLQLPIASVQDGEAYALKTYWRQTILPALLGEVAWAREEVTQ